MEKSFRKDKRIIRRIRAVYSLMLLALIGYIIYFAIIYGPKIATMKSNYIIHITK
ncbi:MAG: hypothetical protein Q4B63_10135 [Clostridium perfringens]|nr:hypothetical protein [Clostridium perfringens]